MPTVVVTGASQGIGRAIAETFAHEPEARLALVSRNVEKLEAVQAQCRTRGAEAAVFRCDVTDEEAVARMHRDVVTRWGTPDVLVNNAGAFQPGSLQDTTPAIFREQVEANLTSAFLVTRAFLPDFQAARRGTIFFMASVAALRAYPGGVSYCAAKHGLLGLARVVREETREQGIRVTTLLPGATFTPSWEGADLPEERFMPPEDIARTVCELYRLSGRTVAEEVVLRPQLGDI